MFLLTEAFGLELFIMNALKPLVTGKYLNAEQFNALLSPVQSTQVKAPRTCSRAG